MNRPLNHREPFSPVGSHKAPAPADPANGVGATLVTMDARKVSPREFIEALGLSSPEQREARRQRDRELCIAAIKAGNTYGFPPVMVAECREIIAEREIGLNLPEGWHREVY